MLIVNAILGSVNLLFAKIRFGNQITVNPLLSRYRGDLNINKGKLIISDGLRTRKNVSINITNGELYFGKNIFINRNVSFNVHSKVLLGNNVIIGENVCIYDHDHLVSLNVKKRRRNFNVRNVIIGNNVWIGSNVVILKGVEIGDGSIISAGSIVTKNIPEKSILLQKKDNLIKRIYE